MGELKITINKTIKSDETNTEDRWNKKCYGECNKYSEKCKGCEVLDLCRGTTEERVLI